MRTGSRWLLPTVACLLLALPAAADTVITMEIEHGALPGIGQRASQDSYTVWLGDDKLREDRGPRSMIVDRAAGKMYVIKHDSRTYHSLELPVDLQKLIPPDLQRWYESTMASMKMDMTVTPTSATREIGGHTAKQHSVTLNSPLGAQVRMEIWTSADLGFDVATYKRCVLEMMALQPGSSDWMRDLLSIEGFPVMLERTVDGPQGKLKTTERLASVERKEAPAGTYAPPAGYTETPFDLLKEAPRL